MYELHKQENRTMIKIAICDDSSEFDEILTYKIKNALSKLIDIDYSVASFTDLDTFKQYYDNNRVDIAFLDVMVNDKNAIDWSILNMRNNYTQSVFMTSYPQCAYNLSETNCCYFIIKQKMNDEAITSALRKALKNTTQKENDMTIVKSGNKNIAINFNDLVYIETFNNNLVLHISNEEPISIYSTLKEYEKALPPNFLRCHKCFMVNMNHIISFEKYEFKVTSGNEIPIPPKKYTKIVDIYKDYIENI